MKPIFALTALAAVFTATGCLAPETFRGWDRRQYTFVECHGQQATEQGCFDQAAQRCPQGYDIAQRDTDEGTFRRSLIFRCRQAPGG